MQSTEHANQPNHYLLLTLAVIVGIAGVYLRFIGDGGAFNIVANILLILGAIIAIKAVIDILK